MKSYLSYLLLIVFTCPHLAISQETTPKQEQIAKAVADYFHLDRENIYVHFDKNVFLTNEQVWFKGYVYHRKLTMPFFATTNIYANLLDAEGKIIDTQLLYGNIGTFSGSFRLNETYKSGKYYIQFYTNWMNNFTEDESAVYEVELINPKQGIVSSMGNSNNSKVNIEFHPEGGIFLQDVPNSIGISIKDCNNKALPLSSIDIVNQSGEILKKVQLTKLGYGRFDLGAGSGNGLKAVVTVNGIKHEQPLPPLQLKGVALEVNNYAVADKMIAKIKTNRLTNTTYEGKPYYMVIQQDDKTVISEFSFRDGKLEQTIVIPQADLFNGINVIRILDADLNQLAERIVFKSYAPAITATLSAPQKNTAKFTELTAKTGQPLLNLSVSVLPENNLSLNTNNDIFGSLLISPYIDGHEQVPGKYFFESASKAKQYELDLFLLNQQPKYKWSDIMRNPPKGTNKFEMGLALKATINGNLNSNLKDCKVRIYSIGSLIDEQVPINDKNEIYLENLILTDSTKIDFSLLEKGVKKQQIKLYPQIFNNTRKFIKGYKPAPAQCAAVIGNEVPAMELPDYDKNTVVLDELVLEADKTALRYKRAPGNSQLRGYKITDHEATSFFYILDYIRYHGFDVVNDGVNVGIYGRTVNTINGQRTQPMVYIDNVYVMDFAMLQNIQTADVDEFYVNQHAVVSSVNNKMGIVRIFMKRGGMNRFTKNSTDTSFIIKDGFTKIMPFENVKYASTSDKGFENFGLIDWQPLILPDSNGEFTLKIPNTSQKTVKVLIEGFSADGKFISEVKTINLN